MAIEKITWLFGWLSCAICLFFTLRCAFVFAKKDPIMFISLIVFAAQWGILSIYYSYLSDNSKMISKTDLPEILPAMSGCLCAISGSLLFRLRLPANHADRHRLLQRERVFGYLLILLVLPHAIQTPYGDLLSIHVGHKEIEIVVTFLLKSIGLFCLYHAVRVNCDKIWLKRITNMSLLFYWVVEFFYMINWFNFKHFNPEDKLAMTKLFVYGFAVAKILMTFTFLPAILNSLRSFKSLSWVEKLLHLGHMEAK